MIFSSVWQGSFGFYNILLPCDKESYLTTKEPLKCPNLEEHYDIYSYKTNFVNPLDYMLSCTCVCVCFNPDWKK